MAQNIVSLHGDTIAAPYEPVESTISRLEDILERARSGDVKGFHVVLVHGDDTVSSIQTLMPSYRTLGAVYALAVRMATEIDNE